MSYKEPAPIMHDKDPLESMMKRFHIAAEYLNLSESTLIRYHLDGKLKWITRIIISQENPISNQD